MVFMLNRSSSRTSFVVGEDSDASLDPVESVGYLYALASDGDGHNLD